LLRVRHADASSGEVHSRPQAPFTPTSYPAEAEASCSEPKARLPSLTDSAPESRSGALCQAPRLKSGQAALGCRELTFCPERGRRWQTYTLPGLVGGKGARATSLLQRHRGLRPERTKGTGWGGEASGGPQRGRDGGDLLQD